MKSKGRVRVRMMLRSLGTESMGTVKRNWIFRRKLDSNRFVMRKDVPLKTCCLLDVQEGDFQDCKIGV